MTRAATTRSFFITGTDTGIGKTRAAIALMQYFQIRGLSASGMKPVASGAVKNKQGLVSEDALLLMKFASVALSYELVNPVCLENPCAPNIAAALEGREFNVEELIKPFNALCKLTDRVVVEGVGGWRTPCPGTAGMADMVKAMGTPVILVVGIRLGCISHAKLTAEAMVADGVEVVGWIANCCDPDFSYTEHTFDHLVSTIDLPLLGRLPFMVSLPQRGLGGYIRMPV